MSVDPEAIDIEPVHSGCRCRRRVCRHALPGSRPMVRSGCCGKTIRNRFRMAGGPAAFAYGAYSGGPDAPRRSAKAKAPIIALSLEPTPTLGRSLGLLLQQLYPWRHDSFPGERLTSKAPCFAPAVLKNRIGLGPADEGGDQINRLWKRRCQSGGAGRARAWPQAPVEFGFHLFEHGRIHPDNRPLQRSVRSMTPSGKMRWDTLRRRLPSS